MNESAQKISPELVQAVVEGKQTLREALALEDSSLENTTAYGHRALIEGHFDVAREVFEGLIALDPYAPFFYLALGSAFRGLGDKKNAFQNFEKAKLLAPQEISAYLNQAEILVEDKKANEARQLLQQASKLDPKSEHPLAPVIKQLLLTLNQMTLV